MFDFIEKLKQDFGSFLLKRKYNTQRDKRFIPIASAKSILILYDAETPENDLAIKKIKESLKKINPIDVTVVGYKQKSHHQAAYLTDTYNCFLSRKDFNFFYQPLNETVKILLANKYDLMFLLTAQKVFPLMILAHYIPASFKVGRNNLDDEDLDFMIDQPQELSLEIVGMNLISHINMLKPKTAAV